MKTYLVSITFGTLFIIFPFLSSTNAHVNNTGVVTIHATYDGFEGGYYIFTNTTNKAVTIYTESENPLEEYDFLSLDQIGKKFKLKTKKKEVDDYSILLNHNDVIAINRINK